MAVTSKARSKKTPTMGITVDDIADKAIIEKFRNEPTDRTRKSGIFLTGEAGQKYVSVIVHGFVKKSTLTGHGTWSR